MILDVVRPEGVGAGEKVCVEAAGRIFEVVVPAGVEAGCSFPVQLDDDEAQLCSAADAAAAAANTAATAAADDAADATANTAATAAVGCAAESSGASVLDAALAARRLTPSDAAAIRSIMEALFDADALDDWIDDHAPAFASYLKDGEQQLEWTTLHQKFVGLVEETIATPVFEAQGLLIVVTTVVARGADRARRQHFQ